MDNRKKKVLVVLSIGSVVLVWRLYVLFAEYLPEYQARTGGTPAAASAGEPTPPPMFAQVGAVADSVAKTDPRIEEQKEIAKRPWKPSPFVQIEPEQTPEIQQTKKDEPIEEAPDGPTIEFVGVSKSGTTWLAAISGQIVRVGDPVAKSFVIEDIGKDWVALTSRGWRFEYHLGNPYPKVTRASESDHD